MDNLSIKRNPVIDVLKGILVSLVLWGHCVQFTYGTGDDYFNNIVFKIIYSFHMPLFMMISGYLFYGEAQRKTLKKLLINKVQVLFVPLVVWTNLFYFLAMLVSRIFGGDVVVSVGSWWDTVTGMFLWYLWSLLFASIGTGLVLKLLPKKIRLFGILLLSPIMFFLPNGTMNLFMYPYFIAGFIWRRTEDKVLKLNWIWYCALIAYSVMILFYNEECYIYTSGMSVINSNYGGVVQLLINTYRYIIGFVGSVVVIGFCHMIRKRGRSYQILEKLGRSSMQIYVMQCLCLSWMWATVWGKVVRYLGYNPFLVSMGIYNFVITPIMAIVVAVILYRIAVFIAKYPHLSKVLFGR